jgi:hypothetical protein
MVQPFVTHQTVRIKRGAHSRPEDGACVMELASMLAGECFSDRPRAVCPVIAAFLRAYNDALDDDRRQDLYPVASAVVGTVTSDEDVIATRVHLIGEWARAELADRPRRRFFFRAHHVWVDESHGREIGIRAVLAVGRIDDDKHASALALVERLIASGRPGSPTGAGCDGSDRPAVTAGP